MNSTEIENVLEQLATTPHTLLSLSEGLDSARLHVRSEAEPWSVNDILAHLRACGDVWGKSMRAMITQEHPTLRYVSPRTWMKKTNYPAQEFRSSLAIFIQQRNELLEMLKTLSVEDWSRGATFTGTTLGREQTVLSYAQRMAQHETGHLAQITTLLSER